MGDWAYPADGAFPELNNQGTPPPHLQVPGAWEEPPPTTSAGFPASRMGHGVWTVPQWAGGPAPPISVSPQASTLRQSGDHLRLSSQSFTTLTQPGTATSGWSFTPGVYAGKEGENGPTRPASREQRCHLLTPLPPSAGIETFQKRMSEIRTALEVASLAVRTSQKKNELLVETCMAQQALSQSRDLQIAHLDRMIQCMSITESDARRAQEMQNSVDQVTAVYEKCCNKLAIAGYEMDALKQQFEAMKRGLMNERDRATMEAGQLRVTYSAKNREVEELRQLLKEKEAREASVEAAHENVKLKLEAEITKLNSQQEKERKVVNNLEESNKRLKSCLRDVEEEVERWRDKAERLQYELDENEIEAEIQESKIASWEMSDEASIWRKYQAELDIIRSKADKKEQQMQREVSLARDQLEKMKQLKEAFKEKCFEADELRKDNEALVRLKDQLEAMVNANMRREAVEEEPDEGYCELLGISSTLSSMVANKHRPIMRDSSVQTLNRQGKPTLRGRSKAKVILEANTKLRQENGRCMQQVGLCLGGIKAERIGMAQKLLEGQNWCFLAAARDEEIRRVQRELAVCRTENREMSEDTYRYQVQSTSFQEQRVIAELREELLEKEREVEALRLEMSELHAKYEEKLDQIRLDMEAESVVTEMESRCRLAEEFNRAKGEMVAVHALEIKSMQTTMEQQHAKELEQEIRKEVEKREQKNRPILANADTQTAPGPDTASVAIQACPDPSPTKNEGVQACPDPSPTKSEGVQASPEPIPMKHMASQASPEPTPIKNVGIQAWPMEGYNHAVEVQASSSVFHSSVQTEADPGKDILLENIDAEVQTEIWDNDSALKVTETSIQAESQDQKERGVQLADGFQCSALVGGNACTESKRRVVDRYDCPKKGFLSCGLEYTIPTTESDIASRSLTSDGTEFEDNLGDVHSNAVICGPFVHETSFHRSRDEICGNSLQPPPNPGNASSLPDDVPPPGVWFGDEENLWTKACKEANISPSSQFETPPPKVKPYNSPPAHRMELVECHQDTGATPKWNKYSDNDIEPDNSPPESSVPLRDATNPTINQVGWDGVEATGVPSEERVGLPTPQSQLPGAWQPRRQRNRGKQNVVGNRAKKNARHHVARQSLEQVGEPQPNGSKPMRCTEKYIVPEPEVGNKEADSHSDDVFGKKPFELRRSQDNGNGGLDVVAAKSFGDDVTKRDSQMSSFDDLSDFSESNRCAMLYGSAAREHAQRVLNGLAWSDRMSSDDGGKQELMNMRGMRSMTPLNRSRLGTPKMETGAESPTLPEQRSDPVNALDSMTAPHNVARYAREKYSVSASVKRSLAQCGSRPSSLLLDTVPESSDHNGVNHFVNHSSSRYAGWNDSLEYSTWHESSDRSMLKSPAASIGDEFQMGIQKMVQSSKKQFETCAVQEQLCRQKNQDATRQDHLLRISFHETKNKLFDSKTQILRNSSLVTPRPEDMDLHASSSVYGVPTKSSISSNKHQHTSRRY